MNYRTKIVGISTEEIKKLYAKLDNIYKAMHEAEKNYIGDLLEQKISEMQQKAKNAIEATKQSIEKVIEEFKEFYITLATENALNGDVLTNDYDILSLPVTLTENELMILCNRNKDDYLFVKACNEYAHRNGIAFVYESVMGERENLYTECKEFFGQFVRDNLATDENAYDSQKEYFEIYTAHDGFTKLDERIYKTF